MADTRHDELTKELETRGWLDGEYHQRHDNQGNKALVFGLLGRVQIGVMAVPDIPAHNRVSYEMRGRQAPVLIGGRPSMMTMPRQVFVAVPVPATPGTGYEVRCHTSTDHSSRRVETVKEAADLMDQYHQDLPAEHRASFDRVVRRRTKQ